jgi:hypothetical protein
MKRHIPGLHDADLSRTREIPDSLYLVRVSRVQYRRQAQKPYYLLGFVVLEPQHFAGHSFTGRLYCTPKALWKLHWFLHDFGYNSEGIGQDEVDEKSLVGLQGIIKIRHVVVNGGSLLNLEGFASAARWPELSPASLCTSGWEAGS